MEGLLSVPPDRNTIIGRAIWKTRYVVLGVDPPRSNELLDSFAPSTRRVAALRGSRSSIWNLSTLAEQDDQPTLCLFVYKQKGEIDPIARYPIENLKDCFVQDLAQRKPGPFLPTLVVTLADASDPYRLGRRSSQVSTLSSKIKSDTIWFRTVPGQQNDIHGWYREISNQIHSLRSQTIAGAPCLSGDSPKLAVQTLTVDATLRDDRPVTSHATVRPSSSRPSLRSRSSTKFNLFTSMGRSSHGERVTPPTTSSRDESEEILQRPITPMSIPAPTVEPVPVLIAPVRRETILDRALAKSFTELPADSLPCDNAVARFELLMSSSDASPLLDKTRILHRSPAAAIAAFDDTPHGISTSTKRALEFISTGSRPGVRSEHKRARSRPTSLILTESASSRRNSLQSNFDAPSTTTVPSKRLSFGDFARRFSSSSLLQNATLSRHSSMSGSSSSFGTREFENHQDILGASMGQHYSSRSHYTREPLF